MTRDEKIAAIERAYKRTTEHRAVGTFAQDMLGEHTDPRSPDAVSWCALGALIVELKLGEGFGTEALKALGIPDHGTRTKCWNCLADASDYGTPTELRAAFDDLIAALPPDALDGAP